MTSRSMAHLGLQPPPLTPLPVTTGVIDWERGVLTGTQGDAPIPPRELKLLAIFARRPTEDLDREELARALWGAGGVNRERHIDDLIWRLRQHIEADPRRPIQLLTVHGLGYRFQPLAPLRWETNTQDRALGAGGPPPAPLGRGASGAELLALLEGAGLTSLVGAPGSGRQTLATWACEAWRRRGAGARQVLRLPSGSGDAGLEELVASVGEGKGRGESCLLHVDDSPSGAALRAQLSLRPRLRILRTAIATLQGLEDSLLVLRGLSRDPALELLLTRAQAHQHDWGLHPDDEASLRSLVNELEGLPLAIVEASSYAALLSPRGLLEATRRQRPQVWGMRLEAELSQAWATLTPSQRELLSSATHAPLASAPERLIPDQPWWLTPLFGAAEPSGTRACIGPGLSDFVRRQVVG